MWEGPWSHPAADLPVYTSTSPGLGPPAPEPGGTGRQACRPSQRPLNRVMIAQKRGERRRKRLNSTNLAFVFSSGCLSTRRVPDGGAWGQIPKREVLALFPEMQGPCGVSGGGSWRPHSDPHSPSSVPESQVRAGPGADHGGSQPHREEEDMKQTGNAPPRSDAPMGSLGTPGTQTRLLRGGGLWVASIQRQGRQEGLPCDLHQFLSVRLGSGQAHPWAQWGAGAQWDLPGERGLGAGLSSGTPGGNLRCGVKMRAAGWGPDPALTRGVSELSRSCRPHPASTATGATLKVTGHQASQGPQGPCSFLIQTRPPRVSEFSHLHTGPTVILPVQAFSRI